MWLAVDKDGRELIFEDKPVRYKEERFVDTGGDVWLVPNGTIKRLLNYPLSWDNEAEEIKDY